MIVKDVETFIVGNPPPGFGGRYFVFVKVTTDTGVTGVGEAYSIPFHPQVATQMIEDVAERYLIGRDPFDVEVFWRRVYSSGFTQRPDISLMGVLSALEMACWDIIGKELNKPVYKLLGGKVHERLRTYTYIYPKPEDKTDVYQDPYLAAERALEYVNMGFTALKFDPIGPFSAFDGRQLSQESLGLAEKFCRLIREAVGDRADLLFGTHGQCTASGARRLAKKIEQFDPLWFEEPTPPDSTEQMARVGLSTSIPIATGERLTTKYEFRRVLETGAASILQMNLGRVGGILEAKKIASMAEAFQAQIAPHLYCGPIVGAANIQLSTCTPNFLILESILDWSGFHSQILKKPIQWEDGFVIPSSEPGLGVQLNEDVIAQFPYVGKQLHLEMGQDPVVFHDWDSQKRV